MFVLTLLVLLKGGAMHALKISISLDKQQCDFIESDQQVQLEAYYREANHEVESAFDITDSDGLDSKE